jgi:hypothetical protein
LDYALARYYDSRTGTFCSADLLAGDPSDPQSWNRYPYGRNDPIDVTDPSGKSWWSSLLIDIGVGVVSYFLGPEIEAWLGIGGGAAGGGAAAAQAQTAADVASGAAIPSSTAGLFYRGAASAISAGVDASAAGAGGGLAWGLGGIAAAAAAQSTDQPRKQTNPYGATFLPAQFNPRNPCSGANPNNLDYSQNLYKGGTQNTEQHILQNHTPGGKGPSFYVGDWTAIKLFNQATLSQGTLAPQQFQRAGTYTLRWSAPQLPWPLSMIWTNNIGWGATGQPTPTNQLTVKTDCKTAITSYPVTP